MAKLHLGAVALLSGVALAQPALAQDLTEADIAAANAGPIAQLGFGLAYNTESGAVISGFLRADDALADGQELGLDARVGEENSSLSARYLSAAQGKFRYGVDLAAYRSVASDAFNFATSSYEISPHLVIDLGADAMLTPYLRYSVGKVSNVAAGASALIAGDAGTRRNTAIGVSGQYILGEASRMGGGIEFARSDLGNRYAKLSFDLSTQGNFGADDQYLWGANFLASTIHSFDGSTHIGDRQILGQSSLRGFAFGGFGPRDLAVGDTPALGGNTYAVLQLDAKFPTGDVDEARYIPGVFLDMGALWGLDNTAGGAGGASAVDDGFHLRASVGVSVDVNTDFGVLALSLAAPVQKMDYDETAPFYMSFAKRF